MADHPNEDRDSSDTVMTVANVQSGSDIDSKMTVADVQSGSETDDLNSKSKLKDAIQAGKN